MKNKELNDRLSSFVTEYSKNYKPNTLYKINVSLQPHLRTNGKFVFLLDDAAVSDLHVLDANIKDLSKLVLVINKKGSHYHRKAPKHTLRKKYS